MPRELVINGHLINDDGFCYIIAEIGHNHQGDIERCKDLIKAAKEAGADAVKLQKRHNKKLYTKEMYDTAYNSENAFGRSYGLHREALEFGLEAYQELQAYCRELEIDFFATPFDFDSADFLMGLDVPAFKIASGDLTNVPLLKHVAGFERPMLISTGGGTMDDVRRAYEAVMPINPQLCVMQCTAGYPPKHKDLSLRVIETFREEFHDVVIGFSSHDSGIAMGLAGYMLGARIIEKHFTLNRTWKGTDHAFSLEYQGLQKLVRDLRRAKIALGDGIKRHYESETALLYKMGKKLVAARDLPEGHVLSREDIAIKSPNDGMPPYELEHILGKELKRPLKMDVNISFSDLTET